MLRSISKFSSSRFLARPLRTQAVAMQGWDSDHGAGAGKGGGSGGSIRDAGGAFGKMEAAREDEYFYKLQKAQLKGLRNQVDQELDFHEQQLKHHQEAIERHKKRQKELHAEEKELDKK